MKQLFFLHSAGAQGPHEGSSDFVAWLEQTLGPDYMVSSPVMPRPDDPDYEPWKAQLRTELAKIQGEVALVGHSLGGAVLLKYLTEEKIGATITGMFLCAAPFWGADEDWQYEPFTLPADANKLLPPIPALHLYHSTNDPAVPFAHMAHYKQMFPQAVTHEVEGDSHAFEQGLPQLVRDITAQ